MRWFHRHAVDEKQQSCAHSHAIPRWDDVQDIGKADRISRRYCPECNSFLPAPASEAGH